MQTLQKKSKNQRGASLIEILIAVLILSLGTLGMVAMQIRATKGNISSLQRSQAIMLSYYILDAMRVDKDSAKALSYNTGNLNGVGAIDGNICNPSSITGTTLVDANKKNWIESIKANVGVSGDTTSCGAIYCDAIGYCRVQVIWDDSRAGGLGTQTVETRTRL